jgi:hypothetical protein
VGAKRERKQVRSGYSFTAALSALTAQGWEAGTAGAELKAAVLQHFPAFAGSWNGYVAGHGYLYELASLPAAVRDHYEWAYGVGELAQDVQSLTDAGPGILTSPQELLGTMTQLHRLQVAGTGTAADHPVLPALRDAYGLPQELAEAVVLHQRAVPGWAIAVILSLALLLILVFLGQLGMPRAGEGAAGPGDRFGVALFAMIFLAVGVWLLRDGPKRHAEWRAALERYRRVP